MTTTTIAVRTSCAALCTKLAELTQRIEHEIAEAGSGAAIDYGALEQRVADALGEVERGLHAGILARLDIDVPAIRVWGDEYRRIGRFEGDYHTLAGTVRVMRTVYRKTERNGDTLDPVSVRAGVVADGWLPHTARAMAHLIAQGTSREAEATSRELARLPYSRSSFERVGHEVGTLFRRAQPRIEQALIEEFPVPSEARSVSISIDRVALPMEPIEAPPVPIADLCSELRSAGKVVRALTEEKTVAAPTDLPTPGLHHPAALAPRHLRHSSRRSRHRGVCYQPVPPVPRPSLSAQSDGGRAAGEAPH
jgi:hypothetical protein